MSTQRQRPVRPMPDPEDPAETVALERPWLPRAGILALIAGVLPIVALLLQVSASSGIENDVANVKTVGQALSAYADGTQGQGLHGEQAAIAAHYGDHATTIVLATALSGLAMLFAAPVLWGLLRASWRRRPSFPRFFLWAPVVGAILFAIGTTVAMAYGASKMGDFAALPAAQQTNAAASDALNATRDLGALSIASVFGQMFVAVGLGAAALSAMNTGLLTRVMGVIGVLLAILIVVPLIPRQEFLRAFWFLALGAVLLGRWPGGRPAAWEAGEARPWPSRAQQLEEAERARA
ncbi:hypothetical protein ACVU7I_17560, partial [Patulibacter sp. S7RM1-6]